MRPARTWACADTSGLLWCWRMHDAVRDAIRRRDRGAEGRVLLREGLRGYEWGKNHGQDQVASSLKLLFISCYSITEYFANLILLLFSSPHFADSGASLRQARRGSRRATRFARAAPPKKATLLIATTAACSGRPNKWGFPIGKN